MKTTILKQSLILLSSATLLAACGGDGGDSPVDDGGANPGESGAQALLYAYPDNGQGEVPTKAPIALRFTSDVSIGDVKENVTLCCDDQGENLDFDADPVGGEPRGVLITPTDELAPGTQYTIDIADLRLKRGTAKDQTLTFTTRTLQEGPKSLVVQDMDSFELSRTFPDGSKLEPVMDFSAFRFQFTQPIDRTTATYGDGNTVVIKDSEGVEVDAGLLVDGAYRTVDPTDDYLKPGETYTLTLGAGLMSTYGEPFAEQTIEFTPKDSSPRGEPGFLVQRITESGTSRLTGEAINQVPVNGVLLGEDANVTQAQSEMVIAELADVTQYTDVTPIRLPKGTLLEGTPIEMVMVGGTEQAGFGSGAVTMRILSDATGYLVPNPYTEKHPDKLRIVHLFMDVGIATENPKANGGFTQNLLHIHLVGVAEVDPNGGVLNIDATSMVEPDVLGQEYGYGLLSFQLQSYKNQTDALLADARAAMEDTTPPTLQSWSLEDLTTEDGRDKTKLYVPGEPIVLNFSEPLDPESVEDNVTLYENDTVKPAQIYADGAALVIKADSPLRYSPENSPLTYRLEVNGGLADVAGNTYQGTFNQEFELPEVTQNVDIIDPGLNEYDPILVHSPVVLATYPGFPCALSDENPINLDSGFSARCAGGMPGIFEGNDESRQPTDDAIPVIAVPGDRPIVVQFHKDMDLNSVQLGGSFKVEEVTAMGAAIPDGDVSGTLVKEPRRLLFYPDNPWKADSFYRYVLGSGGYQIQDFDSQGRRALVANDNYTCDGTDAICGESGLPLFTQPLGAGKIYEYEESFRTHGIGKRPPDYDAGGPDMAQYFTGAGTPSTSILQSLNALPSADTNGNFYHDRDTDENFVGFIYDYDTEEPGPTTIPDPYSDPILDPEGVKPAPNSSKVIIRQREDSYTSDPATAKLVSSINIGCGYTTDPDTGFFDFSEPSKHICPDKKFTYLHNALFAEVTDVADNEKGIKVLIWPSLIMATSLELQSLQSFAASVPGVEDQFASELRGMSGPQLLRMRYADNDDDGTRDELITGWIKYSETEEQLMLTATVDLYLDAPDIVGYSGFGSANGTSNLNSYPISMNLTGPVDFLDDGRMVVEQYNLNGISLPTYVLNNGRPVAIQDLVLPERGTLLQYISTPIKQ
jgi:hypothetical protein